MGAEGVVSKGCRGVICVASEAVVTIMLVEVGSASIGQVGNELKNPCSQSCRLETCISNMVMSSSVDRENWRSRPSVEINAPEK
jgi:hypothetical protein